MALFNNKKGQDTAGMDVDNSNIIGKGTSITGDIKTFGNIRIDGTLVGNIESKSKLALGESSIINGDLLCQNAEIQGEVNGNIVVFEQLTLKATAVVKGDIYAHRLVVESGAVMNGLCKMGDDISELAQSIIQKVSSDNKPTANNAADRKSGNRQKQAAAKSA